MSKAPPIPAEQRAGPKDRPDITDAAHDRRDGKTGLQSGQPGDADANLGQQGRFGNLHQNVETVHAKTQQR